MFDLITTAYAESGTSTTAGGGMSSILMIVVMLVPRASGKSRPRKCAAL